MGKDIGCNPKSSPRRKPYEVVNFSWYSGFTSVIDSIMPGSNFVKLARV